MSENKKSESSKLNKLMNVTYTVAAVTVIGIGYMIWKRDVPSTQIIKKLL